MSLKHIKRLIKLSLGINIFHESIRKFLKKKQILYIIGTIVSNHQDFMDLTHNG